ncbi:aminotransferase class V-fold PLP-dependent enzyme [Deinococcus arenicola]|uniref:Aminotransferase class V-fold PLP-dependent enzyme n=1 Tax=Deinococcus arenicola TaxID=2994950 RepID=A0ABU4DQT0_9DEIO|nr:aminotransferase class V-fold PLP-dependent enzyme [Deinococcus sp. ZS9-10]MDV6374728.1 aminotransferase class V-fold PLP-dependent enzyme [Deinococcus sp. ZS9-10]
MPPLRPDIDPNGLLEYSVVYTDRSLNHMSAAFQTVMKDLSTELKSVYHAEAVAIIPGSGTSAMEAVVSQLAQGQRCLVVRNGWFSYRWSQIFEMSRVPESVTVLSAQAQADGHQEPFAPPPIEEVVEAIRREKPALVFAPHVETSSGIILPEDYIRQMAQATHEGGGLLVIDCIASGCVWLNMADLGIDVLITAPQKGWSSTPCAGIALLSAGATERVDATDSVSFTLDLKKWLNIMRAYEGGGFAYHATLPTDGLRQFRDTVQEVKAFGFQKAQEAQWNLGNRVREVLKTAGFTSVAAQGYEAPGVVVSYTDADAIHSGKAFRGAGLQIAAGVPLQVGEGPDFKTFRIGLFGLDKLADVDGAVQRFERGLGTVLEQTQTVAAT